MKKEKQPLVLIVDDVAKNLQLLGNILIKSKLPSFMRTCRSLDEFWGFIKPKFEHYAERRSFLRDEFDPVLTFLEESNFFLSQILH